MVQASGPGHSSGNKLAPAPLYGVLAFLGLGIGMSDVFDTASIGPMLGYTAAADTVRRFSRFTFVAQLLAPLCSRLRSLQHAES